MNRKLLVTYASKYGATAEIAERVGQALQQAGVDVDVSPVDQVSDLTPYHAVVLGSAVYAGQWRKEAVTFLTNNELALSQRPVWLFSSGPTGEGDPMALMKGWRFPAAQQPIADRIWPRDIAVFGGAIEPEKLNLPEKLIIRAVKSPTGDFRDWRTIDTWATAIANALEAEFVS